MQIEIYKLKTTNITKLLSFYKTEIIDFCHA